MNTSENTPPLAPPGVSSPSLRTAIVVGALALGAGLIVVARHYTRPAPPTESPAPGMEVGKDAITLAPSAPMWSTIKVAPVEAAAPHWSELVPARIAFDEGRTSRLGSPLGGRVTAVFVERGQAVKRGAALFSVSSPNLAELRAELTKATVERATAKVSYDRTKNLVDAGSIPAKELVTAQQEVAEAELAVKLAQQKLSSLKIAGGGDTAFTVTAPRDGVVVEKNLTVGQNVDPSAGAMVAIADLRDVWVVADLFEDDVGALSAGSKAKIVLASTELDGVVDQVSGVVDPDRHTVPVRVRLANPDGTLRPNAYARIKFFDPTPAKVAVPATAVLSDGKDSYVYLKGAGGTLQRRAIRAGTPAGGKIPVLEGLEPGDAVVTQGAILLENQLQLDN